MGNKTKQKAKVYPKQMLIAVMLLIIIFVAAFYIRNNTGNGKIKKVKSETEKLLLKDLKTEYPETPYAVVKLYSRIAERLYNTQNMKEEDANQLIDLISGIYSEELLENNPKDIYLNTFKNDIADYQKNEKTIIGYKIKDGKDIIHWENENKKYASVKMFFSLKENKDVIKVYEQFILRKEEKKWKIVGWKSISKAEYEKQVQE